MSKIQIIYSYSIKIEILDFLLSNTLTGITDVYHVVESIVYCFIILPNGREL